MFTIECRVVISIWRCGPISFKHVSLWCLFFDPHQTTYQPNLGVQSRKRPLRHIYLMYRSVYLKGVGGWGRARLCYGKVILFNLGMPPHLPHTYVSYPCVFEGLWHGCWFSDGRPGGETSKAEGYAGTSWSASISEYPCTSNSFNKAYQPFWRSISNFWCSDATVQLLFRPLSRFHKPEEERTRICWPAAYFFHLTLPFVELNNW